MAMKFQHPTNGYIESASIPALWCLLFGPFYFASKGCWFHAVMSIVAACLTFGISILIYPFFAAYIVDRAYLRAGWTVYKRPKMTKPVTSYGHAVAAE